MGMEGHLRIELNCTGDGRGRATIASTRPLKLTRSFVGKSAQDTVAALPMLFNICGNAQGAAAAEACERALGLKADAHTQCVRALLVLIEMLREHLVRIAMDWPRLLGEQPDRRDLLAIMLLCEGLRGQIDPQRKALALGATVHLDPTKIESCIEKSTQLIERLVLGEAIETWRERRAGTSLVEWAQGSATVAQRLIALVCARGWEVVGEAPVRFLPQLQDGDLLGPLLGDDAEAFVAAPTWNDAPHETSALARQADSPLISDIARTAGYGLLIRLMARLVEIADLPRLMGAVVACEASQAARRERAPAGRGLAQVETARGRLVHGVEIEGGRVCRYAILAPTEWNFHADGCAVQGLAGIAGRETDQRQLAELFITAVDPCVGYEVRIH
ncbi:MAG: hypothetical protein ACK4TP_00195 [Hyphomicrobium sp.]